MKNRRKRLEKGLNERMRQLLYRAERKLERGRKKVSTRKRSILERVTEGRGLRMRKEGVTMNVKEREGDQEKSREKNRTS